MPELLRHVRALAEAIGPRGAASAGEARAAAYIAEAAKGYTHQVWTEPFRSFTSGIWPWLLILSLAFAGGIMIGWWPGLAMVLTALAALCFLAQANGWIQMGWLFPRRGSQNVIAVVPSVAAIRARVVLVSHYDTAKAPPGLKPIPVRRFRRALLTLSACVLTLPALALLRLGFPVFYWGWLSLPLLLAIGAGAALLVYWELAGQHRAGALDNAAGVAAALCAGQAVAVAPLRHTEVWSVFTGCKEPGLVGMQAFLERHGALLADAHFIILESVGSGPVAYTLREGGLQFLRSDRQLLEIAHKVAAEHPQWGVTGVCRTPTCTDASAALVRGYAAMAVVSVDEEGFLPWSLPERQRVDRLDPEGMAVAARFALALTQAIDRRVCQAEVGAGECSGDA